MCKIAVVSLKIRAVGKATIKQDILKGKKKKTTEGPGIQLSGSALEQVTEFHSNPYKKMYWQSIWGWEWGVDNDDDDYDSKRWLFSKLNKIAQDKLQLGPGPATFQLLHNH